MASSPYSGYSEGTVPCYSRMRVCATHSLLSLYGHAGTPKGRPVVAETQGQGKNMDRNKLYLPKVMKLRARAQLVPPPVPDASPCPSLFVA